MARKVRVATVALLHRGGPTIEANRELVRGLIEQAASERPDIICLPETFTMQGVEYENLDEIAETVPGPTTDMVAAYARKHGCYIICPLIGLHGDKFTNDAVLLDRRGEIVGSYSKIHPVVEGAAFTSLERGVTPGGDVEVFDTDFGRIGMQICFDALYEDGWAELKQKGAEIVFWCSAYDAGKHIGIHAFNHHYYVVSAVKSRYSRIVDIMGEELAITGQRDPVVACTIDLDVALFHTDFNNVQIARIREKYGPDVTIRMWHEEGMFTIETNRDDLAMADIVSEFELDPLDDYLVRCARLQDAWRSGESVPSLKPPYGPDRIQWM